MRSSTATARGWPLAPLHVKYGTASVAWFPWPRRSTARQGPCARGGLWRRLDVGRGGLRLPGDLDLTLTDISPGMVSEALSVGSLGRYRRTTGQVADVQDLPFRDEARSTS